jgi:ABC-2 type transport system permease protein
MSMAIFALVLANIFTTVGWGEYFPWSVPALQAGMAGLEYVPGVISHFIVVLTSLTGIIATLLWWKFADQIH